MSGKSANASHPDNESEYIGSNVRLSKPPQKNIIPDVGLEDGDVDVGVEAGLVRQVAVHAPELGVVAQHGEGVERVDEPVMSEWR